MGNSSPQIKLINKQQTMCILLATTAHPQYELILISNRDEFFERKTHVSCWHNDDFILSPFDMAKSCELHEKKIFGTWIGINRDAKIATILNLKLESQLDLKQLVKPQSRGMIPFVFLSEHDSDFNKWDTYEKFDGKYNYLRKTGDFNFFYGDPLNDEYRIIDSKGNTFKVLSGDPYLTVSNDMFATGGITVERASNNRIAEWRKIKFGKILLQDLVEESKSLDEDMLIEKCFKLASTCSVQPKENTKFNQNSTLPMETIFVPPLECEVNDDIGLSLIHI